MLRSPRSRRWPGWWRCCRRRSWCRATSRRPRVGFGALAGRRRDERAAALHARAGGGPDGRSSRRCPPWSAPGCRSSRACSAGSGRARSAWLALAVALVAIALASAGSRGDAAAGAGLVYGLGRGRGLRAVLRRDRLTPDGSGLWPLVAGRVVSVTLLGARCSLGAGAARARWHGVGLMVLCGVLDTAANVLFLLATRTGTLSVSGVLVSLYPVVVRAAGADRAAGAADRAAAHGRRAGARPRARCSRRGDPDRPGSGAPRRQPQLGVPGVRRDRDADEDRPQVGEVRHGQPDPQPDDQQPRLPALPRRRRPGRGSRPSPARSRAPGTARPAPCRRSTSGGRCWPATAGCPRRSRRARRRSASRPGHRPPQAPRQHRDRRPPQRGRADQHDGADAVARPAAGDLLAGRVVVEHRPQAHRPRPRLGLPRVLAAGLRREPGVEVEDVRRCRTTATAARRGRTPTDRPGRRRSRRGPARRRCGRCPSRCGTTPTTPRGRPAPGAGPAPTRRARGRARSSPTQGRRTPAARRAVASKTRVSTANAASQ